jgi:hypothetical protein
MSKKDAGTMGTMVSTTDADIAAFRVEHPLDARGEAKLIAGDDSCGIIQQQVIFEIFHFTAEEVGEIVFDVRGIKDALADRKLLFQMFDTPLVEVWVQHIRAKGGVEAARMKQLTAADLERPPIAIYWPNGYTTVIDGNNRLVRRWDDGLRSVRLAVIPLGKEVAPYMCRPGEEEQFLRRRDRDNPRDGYTTIGFERRGVVGGLE